MLSYVIFFNINIDKTVFNYRVRLLINAGGSMNLNAGGPHPHKSGSGRVGSERPRFVVTNHSRGTCSNSTCEQREISTQKKYNIILKPKTKEINKPKYIVKFPEKQKKGEKRKEKTSGRGGKTRREQHHTHKQSLQKRSFSQQEFRCGFVYISGFWFSAEQGGFFFGQVFD